MYVTPALLFGIIFIGSYVLAYLLLLRSPSYRAYFYDRSYLCIPVILVRLMREKGVQVLTKVFFLCLSVHFLLWLAIILGVAFALVRERLAE